MTDLNRETFSLAFPAEFAWIVANPNNSFAQSLLAQIERRGELSEKQVAAVTRNLDRKPEPGVDHDFTNIVILFEKTIAKGAKKPIVRAKVGEAILKFSLAPAHGKNAGCIYVKHATLFESDEYMGKIDEQGKFHPVRYTPANLIDLLISANEDLICSVQDYGTHTGACGFCALQLKDPVSIALNYGPICADNYGLPHNETVAKAVRPDLFETTPPEAP